MNKSRFLRILSIALSVIAIILLVGLWYTGNNDLSFIPLFIVLIATFCLNLYKKSN